MTPKQSLHQIRLATSRQGLRNATARAASIKLGGVSVWASSETELSTGIEELGKAIALCSKTHLSITKSVLRKLVRDHRSESEIEDRLFSAVLGYLLRRGELDATVCASENDRAFRVLLHSSQIERFGGALTAAEVMLREDRIIEVPRLEKIIFGQRSYNTWSSTAHILGRLSYLGLGRLDDRGTCRLVEEVVC
jgi:hypothetical protein